MIDVIVTKFFPPCFKMAERFENLDNILRDWAKDKVQKSLAEALNRFEKPENNNNKNISQKPFCFSSAARR